MQQIFRKLKAKTQNQIQQNHSHIKPYIKAKKLQKIKAKIQNQSETVTESKAKNSHFCVSIVITLQSRGETEKWG